MLLAQQCIHIAVFLYLRDFFDDCCNSRFVDHMTSTISDVIRTLFRLRQFRSGLSFESDAATNLDRGAIRNAPKSLRPPPRFQSWKNVVNCSVCGNDVAWREAMMGGRAVRFSCHNIVIFLGICKSLPNIQCEVIVRILMCF